MGRGNNKKDTMPQPELPNADAIRARQAKKAVASEVSDVIVKRHTEGIVLGAIMGSMAAANSLNDIP